MKNVKRRKFKLRFSWKYFFLIILSLAMVFPFYWMIITSLKSGTEVFRFPPTFFPENPTFENYLTVLKTSHYPRYFFNSTVVVLLETAAVLTVSVLCAFGLYRYNFKGKNFFVGTLLMVSSMPFEVVIVFNYKMIISMGLNDTYTALILPFVANFFYTYILYNAFKGIPEEMYISAMVEQCPNHKFLFKIALPMINPTVIFVCMMNIISSWNSFLWPLFVTNYDEIRTVSFGIYTYLSEFGSKQELIMAMSVMTEFPLVVVFIVLQKFLGRVKQY